jgi:hypothetical protein
MHPNPPDASLMLRTCFLLRDKKPILWAHLALLQDDTVRGSRLVGKRVRPPGA